MNADPERANIWVVNWEQFQSTHIRRGHHWRPPWIKLYHDLWDKDAFISLPVNTRMVLVGIFVAFSTTRGRLANDTRTLSNRLSQRVTNAQLELLNQAGFIEFCSETVSEQRWSVFMNGSTLELEVDKEPPNPHKRGGTKSSRKATPKTSRAIADPPTPEPELPPPAERARIAAEVRAQLLGAAAAAAETPPDNGHVQDELVTVPEDAGPPDYIDEDVPI